MTDPEGSDVRHAPVADTIVVGGGSAGAVVARRLVDAGQRVLLIEAGSAAENPAIHDPGRAGELWLSPQDWGYHTVPQPHAAGRRLHLPRGKVLGGSHALNAMIWVRGAPSDYDAWAAAGCDGWAWDDVLPVFRAIEDYDGVATELRGTGGPLTVAGDYPRAPIHEAIVAAAQEAGVPLNPDYNGDELDGVSWMQLTIRDRRRLTTAGAYLEPLADDPRLTVRTDAPVERLLLEDGRCVGVRVAGPDGPEDLRADEVVLSAGAIGSPLILLRSGIGPAGHLAEVGVETVVDLPGVGENLHDHFLSPVILGAERTIEPPVVGGTPAQTHLFWRSREGLPAPDVQPIFFAVPMYEEWMEGPANGFSLMAGIVRPESRGRLRLGGPGLDDEPLIDLGTLEAEADVNALVAAVELCRRIAGQDALRAWGTTELYPGPDVADRDALRDYVRRTVITYHHQVGTCRMGTDDGAVVDPRLRVRGVAGLRVADASIMPVVPSGNTNAPAVMIGERGATFLLEDRAAAPGEAAALR
jgi:choline dehydrogenase